MQENNQNFNHLKIHTQYSICEGAIKIDDLKIFCKEKKIRSIGLSDTNNLCGALEFSEEISKSGTQPIIGTQINFKFNDEIGSIPLIAKNAKGYESILELSSNSYLINKEDQSLPYCDLQNLLDKPEGIIILSGSLNSLSGNLFKKNKLESLNNFYFMSSSLSLEHVWSTAQNLRCTAFADQILGNVDFGWICDSKKKKQNLQ